MTRPTQSDVARRLDELDGGEEHPTPSLARMLACEFEPVDTDRLLYRCLDDGVVYSFDHVDDLPGDLVVRRRDGALCVPEEPEADA